MSSSAWAAITVDGTLEADYGAPTEVITYNASALDSNFGSPQNITKFVGYSISVAKDATYWYGFFKADPSGGGSSAGAFANLYFDLDNATNPGSDIGFEVGNQKVFVPANGSNVIVADLLFSSPDANTIEVGIPLTYFMSALPGLTYEPGVGFISPSNPILQLRLSQTFGYSVAGGPDTGPDRLGQVNLFATSVPEPVTLALFGAGLVGMAGLRRRRTSKI